MALAVCLLFDRRSEQAVRSLWDRVEQAGVPSLRSHTHGRHVPHVSYAVLRRWDEDAVSAALGSLKGGAPVELQFDGLGLFRRGRTWLVAGVSADFVARQQRVVDAVTATGADLHKHDVPGTWLPHCSLAPRATLAQRFVDRVRKLNLEIGIPEKIASLRGSDIPAIARAAMVEANAAE